MTCTSSPKHQSCKPEQSREVPRPHLIGRDVGLIRLSMSDGELLHYAAIGGRLNKFQRLHVDKLRAALAMERLTITAA